MRVRKFNDFIKVGYSILIDFPGSKNELTEFLSSNIGTVCTIDIDKGFIKAGYKKVLNDISHIFYFSKSKNLYILSTVLYCDELDEYSIYAETEEELKLKIETDKFNI